MPTIIVRHKVGDINAWLNGQQDRMEIFSPVTTGVRIFQDTDDPNSVLILIETDDPGAFAAVANDPKYDGVKAKHTVIEPITISTELAL